MSRLTLRADAGIGAITASPTSRDLVLAGRTGLHIVDLHDPFLLPRALPLRSAWEVVSVRWCPDPDRPNWVVSTNNQKVLVWNLALKSSNAIEHVLHGHRRAVTDIEFSPHNPETLATASIDTTINVWDLRKPEKASFSFADFDAGALQVKWSLVDENLLASAHDTRVVVWDRRKANEPVVNFRAHMGEVNSIRFLANGKLLTASTDRKIKVWDLKSSVPTEQLVVHAGYPVWRAIPTPYELGCFVVPLRGGDNQVSLINLATKNEKEVEINNVEISSYAHPEPVRDAVIMRNNQSTGYYDLVTWCHDKKARIWDGAAMQNLPHASSASGCKDTPPSPIIGNDRSFNSAEFSDYSNGDIFSIPFFHRREDIYTRIEHLDWISGVQLGENIAQPVLPSQQSTDAGTLSQEIIAVSLQFPKVLFEEINIGAGTCSFVAPGPWGNDGEIANVHATAKFPSGYPSHAFMCHVDSTNEMYPDAAVEINKRLAEIAEELAQHGVGALEYCIRYLVGDNVPVEKEYAAEIAGATSLQGSPTEEATSPLNDPIDSIEVLDQLGQLEPLERYESIDPLDHLDHHQDNTPGPIDSTPLPKGSGAVWSPTGKLVCFFNRKQPGKEKGPLPLDKVFAEDSPSEGSDAPFASDSDDFDTVPGLSMNAANWSVAAAQMTAPIKRGRSHTVTTATSDDASRHAPTTGSHDIVIKDFKHLWPCRPDVAVEYRHEINGPALEMVLHNASVALKYGLKEDAYFWSVMGSWISIDIQESRDPISGPLCDSSKFEWASDKLGFATFLPQIAEHLVERGNIQMLACISCIFSSHRNAIMAARKAAIEQASRDEATLVPPGMDLTYQLDRNGNVRQLPLQSSREDDGNSLAVFSSREVSPFEREGSVHTQASDWWVDPEMSGVLAGSPVTSGISTARGHHHQLSITTGSHASNTLIPPIWSHAPGSMSHGSLGALRLSNGSTPNGPVVSGPSTVIANVTIEIKYPHANGSGASSCTSEKLATPKRRDSNFLQWLPKLMCYRRYYSDLLQIWGLDIKQAEIQKLNDDPLLDEYRPFLESFLRDKDWFDIEMKSTNCAYCERPISRLFDACDHCTHAMHSHCAQKWWATESDCALACGCECKKYKI